MNLEKSCVGPSVHRRQVYRSIVLDALRPRSLPHSCPATCQRLHLQPYRLRCFRPAVFTVHSNSGNNSAEDRRVGQGRAAEVVQEFYLRYNAGDVDGVMELMADDVEYHDLALYQDAFKGKEAVRDYFEKVTSIVPPDLKFTFDTAAGDDRAVGIKWHVEIDSNEFPFSRGCSFYEINDEGKIVSARDLVESATKPGSAALYALKGLAPVVRSLGPKANPGNFPPSPGILMWSFYAAYSWHILLSTDAPGRAAWQQTPEALTTVFNESINFFYVNIFLNLVPAAASHPVSEAVFNFVVAWSILLAIFIFADSKAAKVPNKWPLFIGSMFITNVIFIPWFALRECQPAAAVSSTSGAAVQQPPAWAPAAAGVSGVAGVISLWWALFARPEYGGLADRWSYFLTSSTSDRIFYAFLIDAALYIIWQAALMPKSAGKLRYVPFFGLVAYWLRPHRSD